MPCTATRPVVVTTPHAASAGAVLLMLAGCGGTTGKETTNTVDAAKPLIYGVFATPLEEPWDGAIHAALTKAAAAGEIEYKHVDNLNTSDAMERALRDIAKNEHPDAIIGDASVSYTHLPLPTIHPV